jgi:phosphotransferase system HPr-like phosphotransfer protein
MRDNSSIEVAREIFLKWRLSSRAALRIVRVAIGYTSNIQLGHAGVAGDAKKIMGVLTLSAFAKPEDITKKGGGCLKAGAKIRITARGTDALAAVRAIEKEFCNPELDFDRKAEPSD